MTKELGVSGIGCIRIIENKCDNLMIANLSSESHTIITGY